MSDLKLDSNSDLLFDGRYFYLTETTDETLAQRLKIKLRTFLGEWAFDITAGIPWFQEILGKKSSKAKVDSIIRSAVINTTGVDQILDFSSTFDPSTRQYSIDTMIVKDADGGISEVSL